MLITMSRWSGSKPPLSGIPSSLDLLAYPVAALSHRDSAGIFPRDQSLHDLQQVLDGVNVRVGQPKARLGAWMVVELVNPGHPPQVRGQSLFPVPMTSSSSSLLF